VFDRERRVDGGAHGGLLAPVEVNSPYTPGGIISTLEPDRTRLHPR
jgi:hypothetical protein